MNYNEFINNIINYRGQFTDVFDENGSLIPHVNHHILPRCMGGEPVNSNRNSKHYNLIWLTPHEHYKAHELLALENPDNNDLVLAWKLMKNEYGYNTDSTIYNELYDRYIKSISGENNQMYGVSRYGNSNPNYGKKHPELSVYMINNNPMYNKESVDKRSNTVKSSGAYKLSNNPRARKIQCIEINKVFNTAVEAGLYLIENNLISGSKNISTLKSSLCKACKRGKIYSGYHWRYLDEIKDN